jgi:hypothetical protein
MHYIQGAILELWLYEVINSVGFYYFVTKYSNRLVEFELIVMLLINNLKLHELCGPDQQNQLKTDLYNNHILCS